MRWTSENEGKQYRIRDKGERREGQKQKEEVTGIERRRPRKKVVEKIAKEQVVKHVTKEFTCFGKTVGERTVERIGVEEDFNAGPQTPTRRRPRNRWSSVSLASHATTAGLRG